MLSSIFALGLLPLAAQAVPTPDAPGVPSSSFQLYAYGEGFGGLSVFYWNGLAYLGDASLANDTEAAAVLCKSSSDSTSMVGIPVTTPGQATPSWSGVTYYIPSDTATTHQTGFVSGEATTEDLTTGFVFYGNTAAWATSSGKLQTKWFATPYENTNIWLLNWNPSTDSSDNKVQVTLRSVTPSTPPPNPPGPGNPGRSTDSQKPHPAS
ncbi:hypothetical protein JX265_013903 [Neoarthrinium moseri]|uniref:Uncharacterized protein n=1 Tax=Neoarthrinium moseri TaxID=1658444 RepID=A0A9Q0AI86_9PEZI|nr:hypothetical protein JX265_013903 [Neoarthrinium moseri]